MAPSISLRRKGAHSLNTAATEAIGAEPGESATLCYDEEGERWLLAHWPNGQSGQPQLNALSGKTKGLRFQCLPAATPFFAQQPEQVNTVACTLDTQAQTSDQAPGASLYVLHLPEATPGQPAAQPALRAATKQPGVGRGQYDRSKAKGGSRG